MERTAGRPLPFARLVHADWSTTPNKRWAARATGTADGWRVEAPAPVGSTDAFVRDLAGGPQPTLAGFDFPIGLPAAYGRMTGMAGFGEAIERFGAGPWSRFYDVAERTGDVSLYRPFYPRVSSASVRQAHLLSGLGASGIDELRRWCERATVGRKAACSLFWTCGANQVGKAAISGWREIVRPARAAGARLWPFDGPLGSLCGWGGLVVCETYPAEAYAHAGVRFRPGGSKQRQADRREAGAGLDGRCQAHGIQLAPCMRAAIADGFGPRKDGEDAFDAAMGLFGMIEVTEGRREAAPATLPDPEWEGWILGQAG